MLSRKTITLSLVPSLALSLIVGLIHRLWPTDVGPVIVVVAAYLVGMPIGVWAARRYGRLVEPYGPLL